MEESSNKMTVSILVVEDNEDDFFFFRKYLLEASTNRVSQWDLDHADSLHSALECVKTNTYDIIVLDLTLPDSSGTETFLTLYSNAPKVPIVVLSGLSDEDLALELLHQGAQDYIPKELLNKELIARTLLYALERKRLQDQLEIEKEEVKLLQLQLSQAENLDSLGRMAAGIAHEVKNPLGVMLLGIEFFEKTAKDPQAKKVIDMMNRAVEKSNSILSEMVDFSRPSDLHLEETCITDVVEKALVLTEYDLKQKGLSLEKNFPPDLPPVAVDRAKFEQVLINLVRNAAYVAPENSKIEVSIRLTDNTSLGKEEAMRPFLTKLQSSGQFVVVEVRDFGSGIPPEKLKHIFDPFFTTKPVGEGTGLGLSVSLQIIELHHGVLAITNADPPGARASIILPPYKT
ncbi:MAG: ATP-binding protein [Verrucomicrobiales bacterium]|nr:ATP-binding protein [Verrucomicrobiales bacterium]